MSMDNVKKMQAILAKLQVPLKQQGDICAYTLLAMAGINNSSSWSSATNEWIRIHDIIEFTKKIIKSRMLRILGKRFVSKRFIIFVMRHLSRIMARLRIVLIINID